MNKGGTSVIKKQQGSSFHFLFNTKEYEADVQFKCSRL